MRHVRRELARWRRKSPLLILFAKYEGVIDTALPAKLPLIEPPAAIDQRIGDQLLRAGPRMSELAPARAERDRGFAKTDIAYRRHLTCFCHSRRAGTARVLCYSAP